MKKENKFLQMLFLALAIIITAFAPVDVVMAETITDLPGAGKTVDGASTVTIGSQASPELYMTDIDQKIVKLRPHATPLDNISRYAKSQSAASQIVEFYDVGTKPFKTVVSTAVTAQTGAATQYALKVAETIFDVDDTIRVVGVKGFVDGNSANRSSEDLILHVIKKADDDGGPIVYAVNGINNSMGKPVLLPAIAVDVPLLRMGKACSEIDAQTAKFSNFPTKESQYCQNFMAQIEQSTFDKITKKEVDWNFSDLEEDSIFDMRSGKEHSNLFGVKHKSVHPIKGTDTYFTGGIWWMAGRDVTIGNSGVITDDDLVDVAKTVFTGIGNGSRQKVLFAGSSLLAALSKIKTEKQNLRKDVEYWNLKFKSFSTNFGDLLVIHHEMFDQAGMEDQGFILDPMFLTRKEFKSFGRVVLDLKSSGLRNSDAVVMQEVSCLYLRYKDAHARVVLG